MSHSLPIRVVNSAAHALREAVAWWIINRDKAPEAFSEELERAFELLPRIRRWVRELGTLNFKMYDVCTLLAFIITYTIAY